MPIQQANAELVGNLAPYYIGRNEPNFSWQTSVSSHLFLPGVTGFWPGSVQGNGVTTDLTGNAQTMTFNNGVVLSNIGLAPCLSLPNNNSYLTTPDAVINSPASDMFFACWVRFTTLVGGIAPSNGIVNKWGAAGNRGWRIYLNASANVNFEASNDGTASATITNLTPLVINTWYHIAAVFAAPGSKYIYVNGNVATAGGTSTIFNSTAALELGRASTGGTDGIEGYLSLPTFGLYALPEIYIQTMYQYEKALYGYN